MGIVNIVQLFSWSGFVNGIFSLGIGAFVLSTDWRRKVNRGFFAFCFVLAAFEFSYSYFMFINLNSSTPISTAMFWAQLVVLVAVWIQPVYLSWLVAILEIDLKKDRYIRYIFIGAYAISIIITIFGFTPFFISGTQQELYFPFWPKAGILCDVYVLVLYYGLACIYAPYLYYKKIKQIRSSSPSEARGLTLLAIGMTVCFLAGSTNFLLIYRIPIPPYGQFAVSLWVFMMGYATIRYNPLRLRKVVATELLVAAIWLFLLARAFLTVIYSSLLNASPDFVVFLGAILIGLFLIRSVLNEVKQKEQLEVVNSQLDKSNGELKVLSQDLQQKVDEQTKDVRKALEVEHKARVELEELDKNKDQFILATQHHLRTPLTIIKGYMESLIQTPPQEFRPETKTILQDLDTSADSLSSLVNKLLDISEMQVRNKQNPPSN